MRAIIQTVMGTPPWVWALLALLLYLGIRALRPTTAPLWRVAILPTVFLSWGLYSLVTMHSFKAQRILPWLAALAAGMIIGSLMADRQTIKADKVRHLVKIPGSPLTLVLALLIFAIKYVFGALHAVRPALFAHPWLWLTELAVAGVLTGMFIGRFAGLARQFHAAPHENLGPQVGSSEAHTQRL
ncbi:MAG: hypothetical protein J2P50_10885 [Hyphomicrobiaceae bacterium]|nr:hypothetical protein [Hyphomicrobiaceae bacterium]